MWCPKCEGEMRSYERNGVVVDQCGECRGLFLDRGELERPVEAESSFYRDTPTPALEQHRDDHDRGDHGHQPRKKKHNFLEELFD